MCKNKSTPTPPSEIADQWRVQVLQRKYNLNYIRAKQLQDDYRSAITAATAQLTQDRDRLRELVKRNDKIIGGDIVSMTQEENNELDQLHKDNLLALADTGGE